MTNVCQKEQWSGACCCTCQWHIKDFHHCTTVAEHEGCVCSQQKGWICLAPEMDGFAYSGWPEHGMCEMWMKKSEPNLPTNPDKGTANPVQEKTREIYPK